MTPYVILCAWHVGRHVTEVLTALGCDVSHGLCESCYARHFSEEAKDAA